MLQNKRILITGGTGSLGYALAERMTNDGAAVTIYSRDEKKQYDMAKLFPDCRYLLGDVRDYASIRDAVRGMDWVVHGASLKYVNISELQPAEYVTTNINGTLNLVNEILEEETVERCVGISTDKACLPVNTYGLTKAILEKLILEGNTRQGPKGITKFNVARYGNVIGTRGSVVPFWQERREAGLTLPVTNPYMTRFFFTLDEAVDLIYENLDAEAGVIISKMMKGVKLGNLARVMAGDSEVENVGERPGEKHHELLLSSDEMARTIRKGDYFFFYPNMPSTDQSGAPAYSSNSAVEITDEELKVLIQDYL